MWGMARLTTSPGETSLDRLGVLEREVVGSAAEARERAGGLRLAREHDQEVRAERLELSGDEPSRAFAERGEQHDGAHADRNTQEAESRAQPVARDGLPRHRDEIAGAHDPPPFAAANS